MANTAIPLTNRQVIEFANQNKKIRCLIQRPDGGTAYDEKMIFTAKPDSDGKTTVITISLKGIKPFYLQNDDKRFQELDRGYMFTAFPI